MERLLREGLSLLPFAPIAATTQASLPGIIGRMEARIESEAESEEEAGDLWTATYVLMGLRYNKSLNAQLLRGVQRMKESVTYQAILEEGAILGEIKGKRNTILRIGEKRFGVAREAVRERLAAITEVSELEQLAHRLLEVETWDELLA